jgi:hypothetical protein
MEICGSHRFCLILSMLALIKIVDGPANHYASDYCRQSSDCRPQHGSRIDSLRNLACSSDSLVTFDCFASRHGAGNVTTSASTSDEPSAAVAGIVTF